MLLCMIAIHTAPTMWSMMLMTGKLRVEGESNAEGEPFAMMSTRCVHDVDRAEEANPAGEVASNSHDGIRCTDNSYFLVPPAPTVTRPSNNLYRYNTVTTSIRQQRVH